MELVLRNAVCWGGALKVASQRQDSALRIVCHTCGGQRDKNEGTSIEDRTWGFLAGDGEISQKETGQGEMTRGSCQGLHPITDHRGSARTAMEKGPFKLGLYGLRRLD